MCLPESTCRYLREDVDVTQLECSAREVMGSSPIINVMGSRRIRFVALGCKPSELGSCWFESSTAHMSNYSTPMVGE